MPQRGHFVAHLAKDGLASVDSGQSALVPGSLDLQPVKFDDGAVLPIPDHRGLHHLLEGDFLDRRDEAAAQKIQTDDVRLARRSMG